MLAQHPRVLLVERDPTVVQALGRALCRDGLEGATARNGREAEEAIEDRRPSVILLNPRLGPDDGWLVFRRLRARGIPIVLRATGPGCAAERVALSVGAADCVPSDATPEEVATRLRFVLQRSAPGEAPLLRYGDVAVNPSAGTATLAGRPIALTRSELALLAALVEGQGRVVSREHLAARARASAGALPLARSAEAHLRSLRRKLGDDPECPQRVVTVRGFGYRLVQPPSRAPEGPLPVEATLDALPDPTLVLDEQQRILLLNRAAERLVGRGRPAVVGRLSCPALMGCRPVDGTRAVCPALALAAGRAADSRHVLVRPKGRSLQVACVASRLPGDPRRVLLQLQERA